MLIDPKNSCSSSRQWVALVVGHELAHQWFGNLVTMVFNIFKCSNIFIFPAAPYLLQSTSGLAGTLSQKSSVLIEKLYFKKSSLKSVCQNIWVDQEHIENLYSTENTS